MRVELSTRHEASELIERQRVGFTFAAQRVEHIGEEATDSSAVRTADRARLVARFERLVLRGKRIELNFDAEVALGSAHASPVVGEKVSFTAANSQ